jgi:hypothetical protein
VGTPLFDPYGQALLDPGELGSLTGFLADALSGDDVELRQGTFQGEDRETLDVVWDGRRGHLEIVAAPARNRGGEVMERDELIGARERPTAIRLTRDQAEKLADFLRKRSSGRA